MARITPQQISQLPKQPGIYQYRNQAEELLYIGKAKNLKNRVSSYFQNRGELSSRILTMVEQIAHIDYVVTNSDVEALLLETNMIKTLRPKYNILMRDDKNFPWLILTKEPYPRLVFTRSPFLQKNGRLDYSRCFGPYPSAGALYQTLQVIKKIFPLRQRKTPLYKDRPCMNYHIGQCLGPCQKLTTPETYQAMVNQVVLFLKGHGDELLEQLETDIQTASESLAFERAAVLRDRYLAVQKVLQQQKIIYDDPNINQDIIGCATLNQISCVSVFKVRKGRLIHTQFFQLESETTLSDSDLQEAYEAFVFDYYQHRCDLNDLPHEIILQYPLHELELFEHWLKTLPKQKKAIQLQWPKKGMKADILDMAIRNARESASTLQLQQLQKVKSDPTNALMLLAEKLKLSQLPRRMECYDISHIQGTNTVASMVVFQDGIPDKDQYRRFKIQSTQDEIGKPDDFKSMAEVMKRRFSHREDENWPDPDLIIIDGGKGQLSAAVEVLDQLGIDDLAIVSLAKKFEEVYLPHNPRPVILPRSSSALHLLQAIRDEAHRFAITYHRQLRQKAQTQSVLDNIKGLGPKRREKLLKHFKTPNQMADATISDWSVILGVSESTAQDLLEQLRHQLDYSQ